MQRLLAIDCDARELGYVLATASGERITLESAGTVLLGSGPDDRALTPDEIGKKLQSALAKQKRTGVKVLASVDRNSIELFEIVVPPASDPELPELVLNRLSMESATIADEAIVDFIAQSGGETESRRVTAAALAKTELERVTATCSSAGLTADRLLVRPYETAALFLRQRSVTGGNFLLVNVIGDEVDLIVVDSVRILFFRTVRLPARMGDETAEQRLLDEIRRTLLVAPQSPEIGHVIEAVYWFGSGAEHERLVAQISKEISTKVELLDPYSGFSFGKHWEGQLSGRLVPLLGMLVAETRGAQHAVDFLHPRKAPKPPNRIRQLAIAASLIAVIGGAGGYYVWEGQAKADAEIKKLSESLTSLDALVKKTAEKKKVADAIEEWNSNSVVWLDELRDLSAKFPPGQDLVIQRLAMTPSRGGKANVSFQGLAREPKVVTRMEASLRDSRHEVQTPRVEERVQDKTYSWSFETGVSLTPAKVKIEVPPDEPPAKQDTSSKKDSESADATKSTPAAKRRGTSKNRTDAKKKTTAKQGADKPAATESTSDEAKSDEAKTTESPAAAPQEPTP
ncbi:hypothetical protein [Schlesneria paludicola]|uniref:hypothetical protein n=1 Tax=Schlesneria paludicola TaxID=360056 RepID=UPI00029B1401|nr:hypothetical protein [Schlesneria paludicola]